MFLTPFLVVFIATLVFLAYARRYYGDKAARPLLPPGPVGIPGTQFNRICFGTLEHLIGGKIPHP